MASYKSKKGQLPGLRSYFVDHTVQPSVAKEQPSSGIDNDTRKICCRELHSTLRQEWSQRAILNMCANWWCPSCYIIYFKIHLMSSSFLLIPPFRFLGSMMVELCACLDPYFHPVWSCLLLNWQSLTDLPVMLLNLTIHLYWICRIKQDLMLYTNNFQCSGFSDMKRFHMAF